MRSEAVRRLPFAAALGATAALALLGAAPARAQEAAASNGTRMIYEREVFEYPRGARPDPFRSLLGSMDLGVRFEELTLRGIVYHSDPRESVAILAQTGNARRLRARVGDRIGAMTVVGIYPRRVDLVIEEFGVPRRETLILKAEPETGIES